MKGGVHGRTEEGYMSLRVLQMAKKELQGIVKCYVRKVEEEGS